MKNSFHLFSCFARQFLIKDFQQQKYLLDKMYIFILVTQKQTHCTLHLISIFKMHYYIKNINFDHYFSDILKVIS